MTISGGALFGAVGLVLAAPLTSAIVRIAADLGKHSRTDDVRPAGGATRGAEAAAPGGETGSRAAAQPSIPWYRPRRATVR